MRLIVQIIWVSGGGAAVERGHRRQEQGRCCRKPAAAGVERCCGPWAGRRGVGTVSSKGGRSGVPAAACYSAREEGTCSAGTLGEKKPVAPLRASIT